MQEADFELVHDEPINYSGQTDILNRPSWRAHVSQCLQSNTSNTDCVYNNITYLTCKLRGR